MTLRTLNYGNYGIFLIMGKPYGFRVRAALRGGGSSSSALRSALGSFWLKNLEYLHGKKLMPFQA